MDVRQVCTALLLSLALSSARDVPVHRYVVNLDTPPEQHFVPIFQELKDLIPMLKRDAKAMISRFVPGEVLPLVEALTASLDQYLPEPFAGEMRGIANYTGVDLGDIVMINLAYDLSAFCTSIVAQDSAGNIWHARNLDYNFGDTLRNTTVMIDFQTNGQTLYTATTYLGYVGVLTGQRPNKFTISVDERNQGAWWMNALEALLNRKASVMSFLVRETLAEVASYDAAIQKLAYTPLIAPVYFIVGGTNVAEGAIITRDRTSALDIWMMNPSQGSWFLVETNYDHWEPPPPDDNRRDPAVKAMNTIGQNGINSSALFEKHHLHNHHERRPASGLQRLGQMALGQAWMQSVKMLDDMFLIYQF